MAKRASKMEHQYRTDQAYQLIVRGITSSQIIRILVQEHGISERTAKRDMASAKEYLNAYGRQPPGENMNLILHRIELLYSRSALSGDVDQMLKTIALQIKCVAEQSKLKDISNASPSVSTISNTLAGLFEEAKKRPK